MVPKANDQLSDDNMPEGESKQKPTGLKELQAREVEWPNHTRLVYQAPGKINKNAQNSVIKQFLNKLIDEFDLDFCFNVAIYPSKTRIERQRRVVLNTAKKLISEDARMEDIRIRVKNDDRYARTIIAVVRIFHGWCISALTSDQQGEQRLALRRGKMKEATHGLIPGAFNLDPRAPASCADVLTPIMDQLSFAYPGSLEVCAKYHPCAEADTALGQD